MLTAFLQICGFDDQLLEVLINRIQQTALGMDPEHPVSFAGRETLTVPGRAP